MRWLSGPRRHRRPPPSGILPPVLTRLSQATHTASGLKSAICCLSSPTFFSQERAATENAGSVSRYHIESLSPYRSRTPQNRNPFHKYKPLESIQLCQISHHQNYIIVYHRSRKQYAVEPVQYTPVTRYQVAVILYSHLPLEYRRSQVPELGNDPSKDAYYHAVDENVIHEEISEQSAEHHASDNTSDRSLYGLLRAYMRTQLVFSQQVPAEIRHYISPECCDDDEPYHQAILSLLHQCHME